ncbi:ribulokinase [Chryseolinea sp. T2]|uniref:ribulokinase n=1 Tax=Chryseolinea sp. T2 TaxID=3129255 RepID=UPI003076B2F4
MNKDAFVIGIDYGTDSVRAIVVNAISGEEVSSSVFHYPRWRDKLYCHAEINQFRQHPQDYIDGLEAVLKGALASAGSGVRDSVKGISVDTTGSTPVAVDKQGTPLALHPAFSENPNAMFVLWKDHTSVKEAAEINAHAGKFQTDYLQYVGGIYSSEWFWAKLLHTLRSDKNVKEACYSWVEHCDWIPFLLTGGTDISQMKRGVCSAGHKALWAEPFGGLPPEEFFATLDPVLTGFRARLFTDTYTASASAGRLSTYWAERLGLSKDVIVGVGAFDAHMGAVGGQIEKGYLSKVMGTSTCDMMIASYEDIGSKLVHGICGQVDGSVIPGMIGLEAGQSAFGDTYAWFRDLLAWPIDNLLSNSRWLPEEAAEKIRSEMRGGMIRALSDAAIALPLSDDDPVSVDWLNGRRTPDANQELSAAITGLTLGTSAPHLFKSWVEATCYGARAIVDRFNAEGVRVRGLIGMGGVARKSPYIMQTMANVMNMPIKIHRSEQTCAFGAAMFAATAAGLYPRVEEAMSAMGQGFDMTFLPQLNAADVYGKRYEKYRRLAALVENMPKADVNEKVLSV